MHPHALTLGSFYTGNLIAFTTGVLVTSLLLILTLRAAKLPGTPLSNILFACCALCWSAGGLARTVAVASDISHSTFLVRFAWSLQYVGAAAIPIPILAVWSTYAAGESRQRAARILRAVALANAIVVVALLIFRSAALVPIGIASTENIATFSATILLLCGVALLRRASTPGAVYYPSLAMVIAAIGASIATILRVHLAPDAGAGLNFLGSHLVLLIALCAFFLFARFRYADVFVRYGIRILLVGFLTAIFANGISGVHIQQLANHAPPTAFTIHMFSLVAIANGLLLGFSFLDDGLSKLVNRWLFRPADTRAAARELSRTLAGLETESDIAAAVETAARGPLDLSQARLVSFAKDAAAWPHGLVEGEIVELSINDPLRKSLPVPNAEVLVPVSSDGRVTHLLLATPGPSRPGLVLHDLNFLRMVAAQAGNRFDTLRREQEAIERESREALLQQQVTEAELRALRAQIHPHFLFNSLNTIADLVVRDPVKAETMTLRLARAFRHVLKNASRSLTSVREEMEFLRTYLAIEEVRFSDRLTVEFDIDAEVEGDAVPSLILQPLVENAMKHGLGPKPGPGTLRIAAHAEGPMLRLQVEDDGMGLGSAAASASSNGLGVANVANRLQTLYQNQASVMLEAREGGGTCATILLPRGEAPKHS